MSQLEFIKNELHELIDRVDDEAVLARCLGVISTELNQTGDFWDELTEAERTDILEAYEESKDETNLVSDEVVKQQFAKWLSR